MKKLPVTHVASVSPRCASPLVQCRWNPATDKPTAGLDENTIATGRQHSQRVVRNYRFLPLAEIIARSPNHESALAVRARLHRDAGLPEPGTAPTAAPVPDVGVGSQVEAMRRRLDRLQVARSPDGLGL